MSLFDDLFAGAPMFSPVEGGVFVQRGFVMISWQCFSALLQRLRHRHRGAGAGRYRHGGARARQRISQRHSRGDRDGGRRLCA